MQPPVTGSITQKSPEHWLDRYGSTLDKPYHQWRRGSYYGLPVVYRRQGIVEGFFDTDGIDFEGRADVNPGLTVEVAVSNITFLRGRIQLAWAVFRYQHALLSAKSLAYDQLQAEGPTKSSGRYFVVPEHRHLDELLHDAKRHIIFTDDFYENVDPQELWLHLINTSRVLDARQALARLFVLPPIPLPSGTYKLNFFFVEAHQICDGLTIFRWLTSFIDLLNLTENQLEDRANQLCSANLMDRLPPAQEDLYPPIRGNIARQRWCWAISRILRHTRKPTPISFQNPLRRTVPLPEAKPMPSTYDKILDYTKTPPLNTYAVQANLSPSATKRLSLLCRSAGISVGAGCFALVGIMMMHFYALQDPSIPLNKRLPFVGSFPINPRPFLAGLITTGKEDSLMLAFSDGITLPFLPPDLPFSGRLRVLGRLAHRQLKQYQKRRQGPQELGSRSPGELIPNLYLGSVERLEAKVAPTEKTGINPQGAYPTSVVGGLATCGVSSVGDRSGLIGRGKYDVNGGLEGEKHMVVDFRDFHNCVRVREGEFLVGASGDGRTMRFEVSVDGNAMDMGRVEEWKRALEGILEEEWGAKL